MELRKQTQRNSAASTASTAATALLTEKMLQERMIWSLGIFLGGGFKYFLFSPLPGEMIPNLTNIFSKELKPPPSFVLMDFCWGEVFSPMHDPWGRGIYLATNLPGKQKSASMDR